MQNESEARSGKCLAAGLQGPCLAPSNLGLTAESGLAKYSRVLVGQRDSHFVATADVFESEATEEMRPAVLTHSGPSALVHSRRSLRQSGDPGLGLQSVVY